MAIDDKEQLFRQALGVKTIPILVLDQKWHRLFAIHGKTDEIKDTEAELNAMLARQGKLNNELKELKKRKNQLMDDVVAHMDDGKAVHEQGDGVKQKIEEIKEQMARDEDELMELPKLIKETNNRLMLLSMAYFYEKLKVNAEESKAIAEWIDRIRVELKKNIIRKQNRDINNREIYSYLHDIFGPEVLDLFDVRYDKEEEEGQEQEQDGESHEREDKEKTAGEA